MEPHFSSILYRRERENAFLQCLFRAPFYRPHSFIELIYFTSTLHFYFAWKMVFCFSTKINCGKYRRICFLCGISRVECISESEWKKSIMIANGNQWFDDQWISYSARSEPHRQNVAPTHNGDYSNFFWHTSSTAIQTMSPIFIDNWSGNLPKMLHWMKMNICHGK